MNPKEQLKILAGKKHIFFTERGNSAIMEALKIAKEKGISKVLIQDQGGWLTYKQFPQKLGFKIVELKTDCGLIKNLPDNESESCALLLNSMPGYHAYEDTEKIEKTCKKKGIFFINDASGSIGTEHAKRGDIVMGSFGKWKPINLGKGGFIAGNEPFSGESTKNELLFSESELNQLSIKLKKLPNRIKVLTEMQRRIKEDLKGADIANPSKEGFNVIVRFKSEKEKEALVNYAEKMKLGYTLCPRYIRITEDAVSFEVKRNET